MPRHVLTLISSPGTPALRANASLIAPIRARLNPVRVVWLSPVACDLEFDDAPDAEVMRKIFALAQEARVDAVLQPMEHRVKQLLISDMDSTMIGQECIDELAAEVGLKDKVAAITARAMNGEITMHDAFVERVGLLKGTTAADIEAVKASLTGFPLMPQTIKWLQSQGVRCVVISSGVDIFVRPMAELFGFDAYHCSHLNLTDGTMDGTLRGDIVTKQGKADITATLIEDMGIEPSQALAMGDGANDAIMMSVVGRPFGWRPKPALAEVVPNQFWHSDYRALRYALV